MSNTIDSNNIIKSLIADTSKTDASKTSNVTADSNTNSQHNGSADTVSITDLGKKLASLASANNNEAPIFDQQMLDAIKNEIENGTYKIDSDAIADKLIEFG